MSKTPHDHRPHGDGRIREGDEVLTKQQRCSRCEKGEGRTHDGFHPVGVGRYARCGLLPPYDEQEAPFPSKKLTRQVVDGMRIRHAAVENASDKLAVSRDMAYLSHLDRAELLGEVERLRAALAKIAAIQFETTHVSEAKGIAIRALQGSSDETTCDCAGFCQEKAGCRGLPRRMAICPVHGRNPVAQCCWRVTQETSVSISKETHE